MTIETLTRNAPVWESHQWFLQLYAALLDDPKAAEAAIAARLVEAGDAIEAGLALFLAGTHADMTADGRLVRGADRAIERVADALRREMSQANNGFTDTWVLAAWAGALRLANLVLRRNDLTKLVAPAKNHAYAKHTGGGTLMSSSDRTTLGFDVLLAAVPFGLFDAEDLVLVDAARQLATRPNASPAERQMLAWYFGEQGSYAKARDLIVGETLLTQIVRKRLKQIGQLDARFIRHLPDGNGNRYEPLIEERFPKLVTADNEVIVRAIALPLSEAEPLECVVDGESVAGTFRETHWEFVLPARVAGSTPSYRLRFRDHRDIATPMFQYEVLERRDGGPVELNNLPPDVTASRISSLVGADGRVREISLKLTHPPAGIFGLGERYNALDQAGNRVDQFVYNQYKNQGLRTYIPMPVFYTDKGFGLHVATDSYSWFDFREPGVTLLGVEAYSLGLDFLSGSVNEQVAQFLSLTGEPVNVPLWALGPWMSSNNWDNQAEVEKQVALTEEHGVPATVLVIEAWSDEATFYIFNDATYAEKPGSEAFAYGDFSFPEWGRWPDPKG
ncbi:MAG: hypothetical protein ABL982_22045, partial [Vicinamibacterales bacterium]